MIHDPVEGDDGMRFRRALRWSGSFLALLWLVYLAAVLFDLNLAQWGIYPRRISGAIGIVLAPLIHGSFAHLLANSLPLLILGTALLYGYPRSAVLVLTSLYFGTGIGVWLGARAAWHIGASGLSVGLLFFLFIIGAIRRDRRAIALSMLVFFLYGSMVWSIFPGEPEVSYESHLSGALIGTLLAVVLRNRDPRPPEKKYDWEDESGDTPNPTQSHPETGGPERLH